MAINQNHLFEELDGVKCAIVEKLVSPARSAFLKTLLELNGFRVIVAASPPPKAAPAPKPADPAAVAPTESVPPPPPPQTFTVGVTDVGFNPINAIFGRLLKTADGHVVTMDYWQEKSAVSRDDIPYFSKNEE